MLHILYVTYPILSLKNLLDTRLSGKGLLGRGGREEGREGGREG